jgi:hypothetical protein
VRDYGLVQGALTHPDFRGRNLLNVMLDHAHHILPTTALLARVVPENVASWYAFMKAGYHIAAVDTDPDDERRVFYMVHTSKPLTRTATRFVERHEFETLQMLCSNGWHGVAFEKGTDMIELIR